MMRCAGQFFGVAVGLAATSSFGAELQSLGAFDSSGADVVILGEVHDNGLHHDGQAELINVVKPSAIVFEMLTPDQARALEGESAGATAADLSAALAWDTSGWPPMELYYPVFTAALNGPILGAAMPRGDVRRAVTEGAAALFGPDASKYGLDQPLPDDEQAEREEGQGASHCNALPEEMLPGFVEAQRLRDAHFARVTLQALDTYGAPVVLITGNGHARTDWGVPAALAVAAPTVSVLSLGQLEADPETPPPFDVWRVTAPAEREDPCAVFQ